MSIDGIEHIETVNLLVDHFSIKSPLRQSRSAGFNVKGITKLDVKITAKHFAEIIKNMHKANSPGHYSLSIEYPLYAGSHIPRLLSVLFIGDAYLPAEIIQSIVPTLKKRQ